MSVAPATSSSILVNITGVTQAPSTYSVVGTTLTFSTAPPSGTANISVRYLGIPASGVTTTAYRTLTEFTATASQTTFTPPSYTVGFIAVYQNGVMLGSTDYTATNGTTVVLAVGALVGDLISTESFYVSSVLNALPVTGGTISGNLVVTGTETVGTIISPTALTLQTNNGTTAITVNTIQNVGIGTNSPAQKLDITGNAAVSGQLMAGTTTTYSDGTIGTPRLQWRAATGNYVGAVSIADTTSALDHWVLRNPNGNIGSISTNGTSFVFNTAATEQMRIDSAGLLKFNSGYGSAATAYGCRAWVNFNGTGTVAIRASGNVSSITDNGTGDYTVNFTTAMPDANYSTVISYSQNYGVVRCVGAQLYQNGGTEQAPTTTTARFVTTGATDSYDAKYACVSIFR